MARFDVFTMCNAIFDLQAEISDSLLDELRFVKGSMTLVDHDLQAKIVPRIYDHIVNAEPGGSGANTAQGLGLLGHRSLFMSCIGDDEHGHLYKSGLEKRGITANLATRSGNTGISLVLITPDAQRTMLTYLGQSREVGPANVNESDLIDSRYLYVTAYMWDTELQKQAVLHAMQTAKSNGVKIALSLSDSFCVNRHKGDLVNLLDNYVDIICGNEAEAMMLTDQDSIEGCLDFFSSRCDISAVTVGSQGSWLADRYARHFVKASPAKAIDSTGAGDLYMSGLLSGICDGLSLPECGKLASDVAELVVQKIGPRLDEKDLESLRNPVFA